MTLRLWEVHAFFLHGSLQLPDFPSCSPHPRNANEAAAPETEERVAFSGGILPPLHLQSPDANRCYGALSFQAGLLPTRKTHAP